MSVTHRHWVEVDVLGSGAGESRSRRGVEDVGPRLPGDGPQPEEVHLHAQLLLVRLYREVHDVRGVDVGGVKNAEKATEADLLSCPTPVTPP